MLDCLFPQQQSPAIGPWCAVPAGLRARSHIVIARYRQLPNTRGSHIVHATKTLSGGLPAEFLQEGAAFPE
eukprot:2703164-Pyramimonas_sp.AAC.1